MPTTRAGERQQRLELSAVKRGVTRVYEPFVPGPNPKLPQFIHEHSTPYDSAKDRYEVPAFDRDLVINKAVAPRAIQNMHRYWSKKHWSGIREYVRHYVPEKYYPRGTGLVLDCFSGSGMTGVAALMEARPCVLIDASPAAAFISHCYIHPVDPEKLQAAYAGMLTDPYPSILKAKLKKASGEEISNLQEELDWLYATKCDRCGGRAITEYVVYSERYQCANCAEIIPLVDCPQVKVSYVVGGKKSGKTELKKKTVCPYCLERNQGQPHRDFVISTRTRKFGQVPVLVSYRCTEGCKPTVAERRHDEDKRSRKAKFFAEYDLGKLDQIERAGIPHWYPNRKMMDVEDDSKPWGLEWRPGRDFRNIAELYSKRNLWALAAINAQSSHEVLRLGVTGTSIGLSRMQGYSPGSTFPNMIMSGTYYTPPNTKAYNAGEWYDGKARSLIQAEGSLVESLIGDGLVSNEGSSTALPTSSIDYAFIDPAYVDKVQYGELNFVWESWLGFDGAWRKEEIVVNPFRDKSIDDWDRDMREVLANLYRALKPGRWLSLCYHDTDPGTWSRVQNMLLDSGFEIHTITVLDPIQKSSNQLTAEKVAKGDLVVNCRKPRPGDVTLGDRDETGLVSQRVRDILVEVLARSGGQLREHLWDIVLKRLLARGQLAEHRFDDVLAEVAFRSESGRWFLKEEFENLSDNDVKNEEQAGSGLTAFARLRMAGVPAALAAAVTLQAPHVAGDEFDENSVEKYIRQHLLKGQMGADKFKLGGRMKGVEFYDCLFFYLTRWLKGRVGGKTPRRNLAEFLDEYLVRFKDGDKWLYRVPDEAEAQALKKARQTGLGRRIRQYIAFLNGEGEYPPERRPDVKTLYIWLKHCANFGLPEEGVALWERGGIAAQLNELQEELRYDAEDYYAQCRRRAGRVTGKAEDDEQVAEGDEE